MNILIVYAHHEPGSFTGAMKNLVTEVLTKQGHAVTISDLYGLGFNPAAQKWDFVTTSGGHFNYMLEQKHAAQLNMAFSPDISSEMGKVRVADFIIFVTPLWWHSVPAIMKGWFDRVLAMGFAWDGGQFYEKGLLRGKQAMLVCAVGHPSEYYQATSKHKASIGQFLHPINYGTLAFCGLNVHESFTAMNVLGMDEPAREQSLKELEFRIEHLLDSPNWLVRYSA